MNDETAKRQRKMNSCLKKLVSLDLLTIWREGAYSFSQLRTQLEVSDGIKDTTIETMGMERHTEIFLLCHKISVQFYRSGISNTNSKEIKALRYILSQFVPM